VADLVAALEGLPLAIELAAARTRLMPVRRLRERLSDRLKLLADGDRDRPSRQRSLTASLDGSWDLLAPWARDALVQLAVFEGGSTLEAAEGVLDLARHPGRAVGGGRARRAGRREPAAHRSVGGSVPDAGGRAGVGPDPRTSPERSRPPRSATASGTRAPGPTTRWPAGRGRAG
jgi:hypothetical protein